MRARQLVCGIWSLCFLFCLFCIFLHQTTAKRKLKFVSLVFRHGDHTPQEFFPTDKHKEIVRQQGCGQLTKICYLDGKSCQLFAQHSESGSLPEVPEVWLPQINGYSAYGGRSELGVQQQYELGQYTRRRYFHFLSVVYKQREIYVQSTDCDHTLMSAQASLAGLYPPTQDQVWNPKILWQPIPVHTMPLSQDNPMEKTKESFWGLHYARHSQELLDTVTGGDIPAERQEYLASINTKGKLSKQVLHFNSHLGEQLLYLPFSHCPKYKEFLRETFATRDFQRQFKHYKQFLKFLATHTGYPVKKLTSERIWKLSDTLQYEDINNYTLPVWATHGVRTKLIKLSELLLQAEFGFHKQIQKSRLQGGILLKTILKHILDARKPSYHQKMVMYSTHAATIAALQMALNVFNGKLPPHSACHFFELYQEKNGQYTIEMYYRNNSLREPHPLTLPGCKFRCPLERFTHLVSPILVPYWKRECRM